MKQPRRQFLKSSAALTAGVVLLPDAFAAKKARQPRYQIGLSQYSLRAMFKDGSLDPLDYPAFSVDQFGINQLDLWEGGLPKDKLDDTKYLKQLKRRAKKANAVVAQQMDARNSSPERTKEAQAFEEAAETELPASQSGSHNGSGSSGVLEQVATR